MVDYCPDQKFKTKKNLLQILLHTVDKNKKLKPRESVSYLINKLFPSWLTDWNWPSVQRSTLKHVHAFWKVWFEFVIHIRCSLSKRKVQTWTSCRLDSVILTKRTHKQANIRLKRDDCQSHAHILNLDSIQGIYQELINSKVTCSLSDSERE